MDVPHYYKINKTFLASIGQWPLQTRLASRSILAIVVFLSLSQIGPQIAAAVVYSDQTDVILECIPPYIICIVCFAKLLTCLVNSKKILKLINLIVEDWKTWAHDPEIAILHEYGHISRKMTIAYAVGVYFSTFTYVLQSLVLKIADNLVNNGTEPGEFPFPVYYYRLDVQRYYYLLTGYMCVCSVALLSNTVAADTMFIASVQHICGVFAALGEKLRGIGENPKRTDRKDTDFEIVCTCIVRHNSAIEFAKLIESTYTVHFLVVIGLNMLIMSFTGLQIITRINSPQEILKYVVFINIQMVHLFIECNISQNLLDHSTSIRENIHCGKWYNTSLKAQKLLQLMILRCSKPCKLTAGKICDMSLETFLAVIKTSMSYFTILRSVQ